MTDMNKELRVWQIPGTKIRRNSRDTLVWAYLIRWTRADGEPKHFSSFTKLGRDHCEKNMASQIAYMVSNWKLTCEITGEVFKVEEVTGGKDTSRYLSQSQYEWVRQEELAASKDMTWLEWAQAALARSGKYAKG